MVTTDSLYTSHDFHRWHNYFPQEKHYANFEPKIIYSMTKVDDVYYAFANARYNLYMTENEDYGQMISENNEQSLLMVRTNFLMNALNFYNFAIDLSWQVMFFYASDNSLFFLADKSKYDKYSSKCNFEILVNRLRYAREHLLLEASNSFFYSPLVQQYRELYNYLKHRGTIHFEGLGVQYAEPYMGVYIGEENIAFKMFTKREINVNDFKDGLIELDRLFYDYFNEVLRVIQPMNYFDVNDDFNDTPNLSNKLKNFRDEELKKYSELFYDFYGI